MAFEPAEKPKRGRSKKATASKAPIRSKKAVPQEPEAQAPEEMQNEVEVSTSAEPVEVEATAKKGRKTKATKKTTRKRESNESNTTAATNIDTVVESSMITAQTTSDDSGHETDASVAGKREKKGGKKKAAARGKSKRGMMSKNIEDILQAPAPPVEEKMDVSAELAALNQEIEAEDAAVAKKPKATKGKKGKKPVAEKAPHLSMPGAFSPLEFREESIEPSFLSAVASDTPPVRVNAARKAEGLETTDEMVEVVVEKTLTPTPTPRAAPPIPPRSPARTATPRSAVALASVARDIAVSPTPSAQSSDAENAPPSSRPESVRPPLADLGVRTTRVQLNPGTPSRVPLSPSKIGGGLRSVVPWSEVDVEMVFGMPGENVEWKEELDEREKGMSVQEWIYANAEGAERELRREGERIVGLFEKEGQRAMAVLEGVECV